MVKSNKRLILLITVFASGIISAIMLLVDSNQPSTYNYLFMLPLSFSFLSFLFFCITPHKMYSNIGVLFVVAQLFIRNVVTPAFMCVGNYTSLFRVSSETDITRAVLLMIYEVLWCYIAIYIASRRRSNIESTRTAKKGISRKRFGAAIFLVSAICITLWLVFPIVRYNYRSLPEIVSSGVKDNPYRHSEIVAVGTLARMGSTLFTVFFSFMRIILPAFLIANMYHKKASWFHLVISLILIALQFLFIPSAIAAALIPACLLLLFVQDLYRKQRKLLITTSVVVMLSTTIIVFSLNYKNIEIWYGINGINEYLSHWLSSYFTGVDNVASIFYMPQDNKFAILIHTLVEAIPFRSTVFPNTINWESINSLFTSLPGLSGQIVSTLGSGQYFFTGLFAPLFSFIFVFVSINYGDRFRNSENSWKRIAYLYMCVELALGVGMYNVPITLVHWIQTGIPLLIISRFAGADTLPSRDMEAIGLPKKGA